MPIISESRVSDTPRSGSSEPRSRSSNVVNGSGAFIVVLLSKFLRESVALSCARRPCRTTTPLVEGHHGDDDQTVHDPLPELGDPGYRQAVGENADDEHPDDGTADPAL